MRRSFALFIDLLGAAALISLFFSTSATAGPLGGLGSGLGGLTGGILQGTGRTLQGTLGPLERDTTSDITGVTGILRDSVGRPPGSRALERDETGDRVVRGEVLVIAASPQSLSIARNLNFTIVRQENLASLAIDLTVLRVPDGMSATDGLAALRKADPQGIYDYDHIYNPSGDAIASRPTTAALPAGQARTATKIGMVDAGIDRKHKVFGESQIVVRNVAGAGDSPATAHGTAVASLLVGSDEDFSGALPGATLYAADVFGGQQAGGAADDLARALAWLAQNDVPVANVSLAGPPNVLVAAAVAAFIKRGGIIVAAVGNNGPAAPPCYPAAYAGVVGVTAVDSGHDVMVDANRGTDVSFAALGVDVRAARLGHGYGDMTGTSYAAPIVAARFALLLPRADPTLATRARAALEQAALHLGTPGRNTEFGFGYLDPPASQMSAMR